MLQKYFQRDNVIPLSQYRQCQPQTYGRCKVGNIYSDQKCKVCNGILKHDWNENRVYCPIHPDQIATRFKVIFKDVTKRFKNYDEARAFLRGLRFQVDQDKFDSREFKKDNPLGFKKLSAQWLEIKKGEVKEKSYKAICNGIDHAVKYFQDRNVKDLKKKDFQLFINSLQVSAKSKHNYLATVKQFFKWLFDNEEIDKLPKFPVINFQLSWRKTVTKETQQKILDEIYRICPNRKSWLGIKFLMTYVNCRPNEIRNMLEGDIDLDQGMILLKDTKDRPKYIFLTDEDRQLLKEYPIGLPHLLFFRNRDGSPFGRNHFYKKWRQACKNLGIEGVDLYAGTRHSSVRALAATRTPEEIRLASMHHTNKAFERYFRVGSDFLREIYGETTGKSRLDKTGN